jgi:hypothetical protein
MVLSNAERQAAFRRRLREKASAEGLAPRVRFAVDSAIAALWSYYSRPPEGSNGWGEVDDIETIDEFRADLARTSSGLADHCRALIDDSLATDEERRSFATVVEIADAVSLSSERLKAKKR